jgi:hypothetical protein
MRRLLVPLAAVALLAGCGGDSLTPREALFQARAKTTKVESVRMAMRGSTTVPNVGTLSFQGAGEADNRTRRSHLTMEMEQFGETEVVMAGTVMYLRMEALRQQAPELKPWIELDLQQVGEQIGVDFAALMQLGQQQDPTQSLDQLRAAGEVEEVGDEEVRGVVTTHYRTTVDYERYADQLEDENARAADSIRSTVRLTGQRHVPMEIWVDDEQLVRRMKWTQRLRQQGQRTTTTTTLDLYDFGARVAIDLPPRDDVMTFEELMKLPQQAQAEGTG